MILVKDILSCSYVAFVSMSTVYSGMSSMVEKMWDISGEPGPKYKHRIIEQPINTVYQGSRIIGAGLLGSTLGGVAAATFPVSIPIYAYYRNKKQ